MKAVTSAEMREMDRKTIEDYGVPSLVLMENAALRVVEILTRDADWRGKKIAVVCGKGNNGGDGLAVARHLDTRFHADVTVWLLGDETSLSPDASANLTMARAYGLDVRLFSEALPAELAADLNTSALILDALFGTGFQGVAQGVAAQLIAAINQSPARTVAIDIPSGLNADTGRGDGPCVQAQKTITFAFPKVGLILQPGATWAGELEIVDLGMPRAVMQAETIKTCVTETGDVARWLPSRTHSRDNNKGTFGHVTVFAGAGGFLGAAALSSEAAARTGSGLVTLAVPESVLDAAMSRVTPVVMTVPLPETHARTFDFAGLEAALALAQKGTVAAIGPGLGVGRDPSTRRFALDLIAQCPCPLVIDADALTALSLEDDHGAVRLKARSAPTVLTPHPGELARLLGCETAQIQADRRAAVTQAAEIYGCVVLLKGDRTLIAAPDGTLYVNTTGNPGMATGGAGDVLTGVIAALLAQHLDALAAAAAGAYVHGLAGDLAAMSQGGSTGLIATDLLGALPRALALCQGRTASL